jgi:NADPH:quinone reductase-like Zn-dependent oxidoreductase
MDLCWRQFWLQKPVSGTRTNTQEMWSSLSEGGTMKAIVCTKYGLSNGIQLQEVEKPAPMDNEVLVKIYAASANTLDLQIKGGMARIWGGLRKPKDPRLGRDMAGQVEAVGSRVTQFKPGDEVFGVCGGSFPQILQSLLLGPLNSKTGGQKMGFMGIAKINRADLDLLKGLFETGKVVPVIDRRYPLSETAEALRYLAEGHAKGKIVITVEHNL